MKVLVTGGRDYSDWQKVYAVLDSIKDPVPSVIIQGGARGADYLARDWANSRLIPLHTYKADWKKYGKAAGPIRNKIMLEQGNPDLVVAFPGGNGTKNMIEQARRANVKIMIVE